MTIRYDDSRPRTGNVPVRGDTIVWTGKATDDRNEFIRFDPAAGKVMGQVEDCPRPRFNGTGDRFARFVGPKVTMFRTN